MDISTLKLTSRSMRNIRGRAIAMNPITSWGVLLKEVRNVRSVALHPWLLIPVFFVIITVLSFNFLGNGLRDAADPYK